MAMKRRIVFVLLAAALALPDVALAAGKTRRLVLQVSDNDAEKMNAVLNVAANVSRHYAALGDEVEVVVVAFNAGLHMLRADTSPVKARLESFAPGMPNVSFQACGNTMEAMKRREDKEIPILPMAKIVPAGVVSLIELSEKGWVIVRP
jgi:intracellular sulfur oxidation DsrE/DsrF family protein